MQQLGSRGESCELTQKSSEGLMINGIVDQTQPQIAALGTAHVTCPARWKPRHHGASN